MSKTITGEPNVSSQPWTPWTIVHRDNGQPVLPMDCNPTSEATGAADFEALLVYRSKEAAAASCEHQKNWEVDAEPRPLSDVIDAEAKGQKPTEDGMGYLKRPARDRIYEAQGLAGPVGKIGPEGKI